jgi:hypothetical protein
LAITGLAVAQDQDSSGDPPSRVARLQYIDGLVSLQPGGVDDWVDANLNRPLTTADRVWTDRDAKAELTMASAALRMGSETSVTLTNLDDNTAQIELDQGVLELSVRYLNPGEIVEVDTPNFAYTLTQPGEYRFDVLPDEDQSWITVRHGDGEATGEGNAVRVHSGQQVRFSTGQSLMYTSSGAPERDGFDDWCSVRERRETSSASASYVAAGTVGYEDLDDNGYWQPTPTYGAVWYPRVHAGWAPYREGHWAWVEPWGWTWVDDAPWGFAPFHYGRWVFVGDRWGWVPGPVGVRPVYAPALVGWVGGAGFGVSLGFGGGGGVGWFPLGWHDPYLPSYHVSAVYARNVNISNSRVVNVTVINNYYTTTNVNIRNTTISNIRYENATVNGATTGVSSSAFASGQSLRGSAVVVPASAVGRSSMMTAAAVVPTKAAVLGGRPPAAAPQHMVAPRQVVSRVPPPSRPLSFEQQRPMLEKNNGVPLAPDVRSNLRKSNPPPAVRSVQPAGNQPNVRPGAPQPANQPGGRFGRPGATNGQGTSQPAVNTGTGAPGTGNAYGRPNNPVTTNDRPATTTTPAANANPNAPVHNAARPPQTGGAVNGQQAPHAPVVTMEGHAPAADTTHTNQAPPKTNQGSVAPPARPVTPARPATPPAPGAAAHPTKPPAAQAAPATQHRNPPPAKTPNQKEKEDREKEKDPRGR